MILVGPFQFRIFHDFNWPQMISEADPDQESYRKVLFDTISLKNQRELLALQDLMESTRQDTLFWECWLPEQRGTGLAVAPTSRKRLCKVISVMSSTSGL